MGKKRSRDAEAKDVPEDPAVDKMDEDSDDDDEVGYDVQPAIYRLR